MSKELFNLIKEKSVGKLTDEQIQGIVEKINLENKVPEVITTSNPYEFEKNSINKKYIFEHSWAGSEEKNVNTEVVVGDFIPGIDYEYEYSNNGDTRTPEERHEMSEFSINQVQVTIVNEQYSDHFNGSNIDEDITTIQIYLPEEKEYSENVSFKHMVLSTRKQNLFNAIKEKVAGKLTEEQIQGIVEKINFETEKVPEIVTSANPYEFEKNSRNKKDIFEHSWAGSTENNVNTEVVVGDFIPGIDDVYEYSNNGDYNEPEEKHEMSDFSINQVQVTIVNEQYSDCFNGADIYEDKESIQIYLPEEKEYTGNVSFKRLMIENEKEKLKAQIIDAQNEGKKLDDMLKEAEVKKDKGE